MRCSKQMKPTQLAAFIITVSVCVACAFFFQESANKDAFFLREFGVSVSQVNDLKVTKGRDFKSSYSIRRFKSEKLINLKYASDFQAPYDRKWKEGSLISEFIEAFPQDKDALSEKDQLECLQTSYKNSSGEIKKTLLTNKNRKLYWYRIESSS